MDREIVSYPMADAERGAATTASMLVHCTRNLRILRHISHDHVAKILGASVPDRPEELSKVDVFFEPFSTEKTLTDALNDDREIFTIDRIRSFAFMMLTAVEKMHAMGVVHRNMKPEKWVFRTRGSTTGEIPDLLLLDFTPANFRPLARSSSSGPQHAPEGLVSALYRAPEVFSEVIKAETEARPLNIHKLDPRLDIWSIGVMLAKMFPRLNERRRLPFIPAGPTEKHIVKCTLQAFGWAEGMTDLPPCTQQSSGLFGQFLVQKEDEPHNPEALDPLAVDLLRRMLAFQVSDRYSADQCVSHKFFEITDSVRATCPNFVRLKERYLGQERPPPALSRNRYTKNSSSQADSLPRQLSQFNDLADLRFHNSEHFHTNVAGPSACPASKAMYTEAQVILFRELQDMERRGCGAEKQRRFFAMPVNNIWTTQVPPAPRSEEERLHRERYPFEYEVNTILRGAETIEELVEPGYKFDGFVRIPASTPPPPPAPSSNPWPVFIFPIPVE